METCDHGVPPKLVPVMETGHQLAMACGLWTIPYGFGAATDIIGTQTFQVFGDSPWSSQQEHSG